MEIADEKVAVFERERHEGAAHENELNLIHRVTQTTQLVDAAAGLDEGVIAGRGGKEERVSELVR